MATNNDKDSKSDNKSTSSKNQTQNQTQGKVNVDPVDPVNTKKVNTTTADQAADIDTDPGEGDPIVDPLVQDGAPRMSLEEAYESGPIEGKKRTTVNTEGPEVVKVLDDPTLVDGQPKKFVAKNSGSKTLSLASGRLRAGESGEVTASEYSMLSSFLEKE